MKDAFRIQDTFKNSELFADVNISNIDPATGLVNIEITCSDECYNDVVSEILGENISDKTTFIEKITKF